MVDGVLDLVLEDFQIELVAVTVLSIVAQRQLGDVFGGAVAVREGDNWFVNRKLSGKMPREQGLDLIPEEDEDAFAEGDAIYFGIKVYVGFDGVHEADGYLVCLVKHEQVGMTVLDRALDGLDDCLLQEPVKIPALDFINRNAMGHKPAESYSVFVDLVVVRKVPRGDEQLEVLALDSASKQAVGDELDHVVLALSAQLKQLSSLECPDTS